MIIPTIKTRILLLFIIIAPASTILARPRRSRGCAAPTTVSPQASQAHSVSSLPMQQPMTRPAPARSAARSAHSNLIELKAGQNLKDILSKNPNTVLYFYNDHCEPCHWMRPRFESVVPEYPNIMFIEINTSVDEFVLYQLEYKIKGWPSLVLYKNGQRIMPVTDPRNNELYEYLGGPRDEQGVRDVLNMAYKNAPARSTTPDTKLK